MSKETMSFVKGMGMGLAAGVVTTVVGKAVIDNKKSLVKKTEKAVKTVGEIMDNINGMLK